MVGMVMLTLTLYSRPGRSRHFQPKDSFCLPVVINQPRSPTWCWAFDPFQEASQKYRETPSRILLQTRHTLTFEGCPFPTVLRPPGPTVAGLGLPTLQVYLVGKAGRGRASVKNSPLLLS